MKTLREEELSLLFAILQSARLEHLESKVGPQLLDLVQPFWVFQVLKIGLAVRIVQQWLGEVFLFDWMRTEVY